MNKTIHNTLTACTLTLLLLPASINTGYAAAQHASDPDSMDTTTTAATPAAIKDALSRIIPGRQPDSISATAIPGLLEIIYETDIFYLTEDGKHLFQGDIYSLDSQTNLTEAKRAVGRVKVIDAIDPATMIVFKPAKTRHVVTVFTDIDCGYCRKLHSEIDSYLSRGIEIRYLAFPRTGINTPSYFKAVTVWCSEDRQKALTIAKSGVELENKSCDNQN